MKGHGLLIWLILKLLILFLKILISSRKKKLFKEAKQYIWDDPYLFKIGADNLLRRCVTNREAQSILWHCHNSPYGGHFNGERTAAKVL